MKRKDIVNFAPKGESSAKKLPPYVGLIITACLLVFLASVFIILAANDFDIAKAVGVRMPEENQTQKKEENENTEVYKTDIPLNFTDTVNFLLLCSDGGELTFCQIVCAAPADGIIKIKPISPDHSLKYQDGEKPLSEAFRSLSPEKIAEAFSCGNMPIKKYVSITEENFVRSEGVV